MTVRGEAAQEFIDAFSVLQCISAGNKVKHNHMFLLLEMLLFLHKLTSPESFIMLNICKTGHHVLLQCIYPRLNRNRCWHCDQKCSCLQAVIGTAIVSQLLFTQERTEMHFENQMLKPHILLDS